MNFCYKKQIIWWVGGLSIATAIGCSGGTLAPDEGAEEALPSGGTADRASLTEAEVAQSVSLPAEATQPRPQLIKQASLRIELEDIDGGIETIAELLAQYQGDLLELSDQETQASAPRQVWLELRVPQNSLDPLLDELRALGKVQEQSITAEDVSAQLVDLDARVRNLRQAETALLEIMERSGSIADVLEVARELTNIRETIERTDAQLKNLQNQVAYSTVSVTLISQNRPAPTTSPLGETLSRTWQRASFSVRALSVGVLQLLLWLLVFSPYIAIALLAIWAGRRYWRTRHSKQNSSLPPQQES